LVCKCQLHFLCFSSKYVMSWSQMKFMSCFHTFTHSHQIDLCLSYICLVM
jgi:hypothetical protein